MRKYSTVAAAGGVGLLETYHSWTVLLFFCNIQIKIIASPVFRLTAPIACGLCPFGYVLKMEQTDGDDRSETSSSGGPSPSPVVVLPKSGVLRAIETILGERGEPVGRKAKIKATYQDHRRSMYVDWLCTNKLHLPVFRSHRSNKPMKGNSLRPVFDQMRLCLLAGDWDSYRELLLMTLKSPKIANDYILFAVRSCFVLLLNHPHRTSEMVDNFIASCLSINEESRKKSYLQECFSLRFKPTCTEKKHTVNKETEEKEKEEEEEEEIIFNSDFSSD